MVRWSLVEAILRSRHMGLRQGTALSLSPRVKKLVQMIATYMHLHKNVRHEGQYG